jgi:hypothetical protein
MFFKEIEKKEIMNEIMSIDTLSVLAGTVGTLHAASAVHTVEDYRYALRCKKAGVAVKPQKQNKPCNGNNEKAAMPRPSTLFRPAVRDGRQGKQPRQNRSRAHLRVV